mmetsp:Transcript_17139/g.22255  ORF Transcript_17139/g.22255 Transcript_17139/m.22255 type:complete len:84 (+) Transcript_17139:957-1208(+)
MSVDYLRTLGKLPMPWLLRLLLGFGFIFCTCTCNLEILCSADKLKKSISSSEKLSFIFQSFANENDKPYSHSSRFDMYGTYFV